MDREKLTKAIVEYCEDFANGIYKPSVFDISDAFKQGTDWLMQQPLSERLTDEEKEKILDMYRWATECTDDNEEAAVTQTILENIFGAELFKEK